METITIVVAVDKNYLQHLCVMLCSLFENNLNNQFRIFILNDFPINQPFKKVIQFIQKYGHQVEVIKVSKEKIAHFKISDHVSLATYYRVLIPTLLDSNIEKVLYLDSDMIVKSDIKELWLQNIDDFIIGAIPEPYANRNQDLGIPLDIQYFNAGVLLMNLKKWRNLHLTSTLIDFIEKNPEKLMFWDQDALNAILYNQYLSLPIRWNLTQSAFMISQENTDLTKQFAYREAIQHVGIIHFTGTIKPWSVHDTHPFKKDYYFYLKKTPWRNYRPAEEKAWHKLKQFIKRYFINN